MFRHRAVQAHYFNAWAAGEKGKVALVWQMARQAHLSMLRVAAELRFSVGSIAVNNDANARFSLITERPFLGAQSTSAPAAAPRLSQCKLAAGLPHRARAAHTTLAKVHFR